MLSLSKKRTFFYIFLGSIIVLNLILAIFTNQVILKDYALSSDEYGYLFMAKVFASGHLNVPTPELKEFFQFNGILMGNATYAIGSPGWPMLLTIGVLSNSVRFINLFFYIGTLILIVCMALKYFSRKTALISLMITLGNPFLIFNSASYFNHMSCLFFLTVSLFLCLECINSNSSPFKFALLGSSLGIAFLIRPLTALAFGLPMGTVFLCYFFQKKINYKRILILILYGTIFLSIFLAYNYFQTRNPFEQPYTKYGICDSLGKNPCSESYAWGIQYNIGERLKQLNQVIPFSAIFIIAGTIKLFFAKKIKWIDLLLFGIFYSQLALYFFYLRFPGHQYGPRYIFETSVIIILLMASSIEEISKKSKFLHIVCSSLVLLIIILNILNFTNDAKYFNYIIQGKTKLPDYIQEHGIINALIFIDVKNNEGDLYRNGIYFNNSVLYVQDLGLNNNKLIAKYPSKSIWYYRYNATDHQGYLKNLNNTITVHCDNCW